MSADSYFYNIKATKFNMDNMGNVDNLQLRHIDTLLNLAVLIEYVKSNSKNRRILRRFLEIKINKLINLSTPLSMN